MLETTSGALPAVLPKARRDHAKSMDVPYWVLIKVLGKPHHEHLQRLTIDAVKLRYVCYGWACGCMAAEIGIGKFRTHLCPVHLPHVLQSSS